MLSVTATLTHNVRLAIRDIRGMLWIEGVSPAATGATSSKETNESQNETNR